MLDGIFWVYYPSQFATCRRIRNIIDSSRFEFGLKVNEMVLLDRISWDKLECLQRNSYQKISLINFTICREQNEQGVIDDGDVKLKFEENFCQI